MPKIGRLFVLSLSAAVTLPSWAALGGDVKSVLHDHEELGAQDIVTQSPGFELHEAQTYDGLRVRQYVDRASGRVFATTWQGPRLPRVGDLLGGFASRYYAAASGHRGGHHALSISEPDFALTILRLPRGWSGQAFVPAALPAGVDRREIR
jgi:hypothetical protein